MVDRGTRRSIGHALARSLARGWSRLFDSSEQQFNQRTNFINPTAISRPRTSGMPHTSTRGENGTPSMRSMGRCARRMGESVTPQQFR